MPSTPALTAKERLKVIIESSTPVVVVETVEEQRAIQFVREAAAELHLPAFEWSVADGLVRTDDPAQTASAPAAGNLRQPRPGGAGKLAEPSSLLGQINSA